MYIATGVPEARPREWHASGGFAVTVHSYAPRRRQSPGDNCMRARSIKMKDLSCFVIHGVLSLVLPNSFSNQGSQPCVKAEMRHNQRRRLKKPSVSYSVSSGSQRVAGSESVRSSADRSANLFPQSPEHPRTRCDEIAQPSWATLTVHTRTSAVAPWYRGRAPRACKS